MKQQSLVLKNHNFLNFLRWYSNLTFISTLCVTFRILLTPIKQRLCILHHQADEVSEIQAKMPLSCI